MWFSYFLVTKFIEKPSKDRAGCVLIRVKEGKGFPNSSPFLVISRIDKKKKAHRIYNGAVFKNTVRFFFALPLVSDMQTDPYFNVECLLNVFDAEKEGLRVQVKSKTTFLSDVVFEKTWKSISYFESANLDGILKP